jgi:hypothetical protein
MLRTTLMTILCFMLSTQANADTDNIKTATAIQNADGVTDATWTTELLKYQEKVISERAMEEARQSFIFHGGQTSSWKPRISNESNFFIVKNKKFGIIKSHLLLASQTSTTHSEITVNTTKILAIKGSNMISVTCARSSNKQISLIDGPCNDAIKEQFGVSLEM